MTILCDRLGNLPRTRQRTQLTSKRLEDIRASPRRTESDLPAAAGGYDESGGLVVVGERVCVGADRFSIAGVEAGGALGGGVVGAGAAVGRGVGFGAGREARVEGGALDLVVWVRIDTVAGFGGGSLLQVPGTPTGDAGVGLFGFVGDGVGCVCGCVAGAGRGAKEA